MMTEEVRMIAGLLIALGIILAVPFLILVVMIISGIKTMGIKAFMYCCKYGLLPVANTIPAGSIVKTDANVNFLTDSDLVFAAPGSDDVTATCDTYGPYNAAIGEVDIIGTTVYGWTTATNAAAVVPGRLRELDADHQGSHL